MTISGGDFPGVRALVDAIAQLEGSNFDLMFRLLREGVSTQQLREFYYWEEPDYLFLALVHTVIDIARFTFIWRGRVLTARAFPSTSGLERGDTVLIRKLPASKEYFTILRGDIVVIAGNRSSGNRDPFVAWTKADIFTTNPTWTLSINGLPSLTSGNYEPVHMVKLHLTDSNICYLCLPNFNSGIQSDELWRNTNLQGGGVWEKVFDVSTHNTLSGRSDTQILIFGRYNQVDRVGDFLLSEAEPDLVALAVEDFSGTAAGPCFVAHSHDKGATFHHEVVIDGGQMKEGSAIWSRHNKNRAYVWDREYSGITSGALFQSNDGGHTFTYLIHPNPGSGGSSASMYSPFGLAGDVQDQLIWIPNPYNTSFISTTSGGSWTSLTPWPISRDGSLELTSLAPTGLGIGTPLKDDTAAYRTTTGGSTWSFIVTSPQLRFEHIARKATNKYIGVGGTNSKEVFSSLDWINFTTRIGNLHTLVGVNPNVYAVSVGRL